MIILKSKYIKRWKGKDGKWNYLYPKPSDRGTGSEQRLVPKVISNYTEFTKTEFGYLDSALTSDETDSMGRYTTSGYEMNKDLRSGKENYYANDIKGAFKKIKPLSEDIRLFRGLSVTNDFLDQLKSSEYITDKAFTSLTSDPGSALSFFTKAARGENEQKIILRVDIPKGSKVLDMQNPIEKEFLLNTGSKFKMGKIQKSKDNKFYIMDVTYE